MRKKEPHHSKVTINSKPQKEAIDRSRPNAHAGDMKKAKCAMKSKSKKMK